jgi:hypothetical protein
MLRLMTLAGLGLMTLLTAGAPNRALAAEGAGALTDGNLRAAMDDLGMQVTGEYKTKDGRTIYDLKVERNGRNYFFTVLLSESRTRLWIHMNLVKADNVHESNAPRLLKLLALTMNHGPACFNYDDVNKYLVLSASLENREVTRDALKFRFDATINVLDQTRADWDFDWTKPATTAAQTSTTNLPWAFKK